MGEHERRGQPNGLLPNAGPLIGELDLQRWLKAEERTAELIACIQPNRPSENRRNAVADYVQRLITKCFPCQVFTFGSVPLKTYLPDGDIDLTSFSINQNLKDSWANQVRDVLEKEEKNENAEFRVKEVQYIQAEVKIIKCLVENIVVDISFNQLGGLCALCFLEEVDHLISHNHLFKRSVILIKAWCYYESRILGAHHGLISTYALEMLVLYIFQVYNNSFSGPLEVLFRFLEFFSNFDWDNFCVSLWGPVPISSLPDVTAEPPRKGGVKVLFGRLFLEACSSVYAVFPGGQESHGQTFVSKHFNVIDPLRVNNNLGRSVSKGNFFRIRSAFAFGAKRLARLVDCPEEDLVYEVNRFFMNTWERYGSGNRPDARMVDLDNFKGSEELISSLSGNDSNKDFEQDKGHRNVKPNHARYLFPRTRSSPELTRSFNDFSYGRRNNEALENVISLDRRKNLGSDAVNHFPQSDSDQFQITGDEQCSVSEIHDLQQEQVVQGGLNGQVHMPFGLASAHVPFPVPPSLLSSMVPANMQYPQGLVSQQLAQYFHGLTLTPSSVDTVREADNEFWQDHDAFYNGDGESEAGSGTGSLEKGQQETHLVSERRTSPKFPSNVGRSRTSSSESSWDDLSVNVSMASKEKKGKGKNLTEQDESGSGAHNQMAGHESEPTRPEPVIDNSAAPPFAFYATGPPVPFLTMLPPISYLPSDAGTSREDSLDGSVSSQNLDSFEGSNVEELSTSSLGQTASSTPSDILNSDLKTHWRNLQFGRICQNPQFRGPVVYPSSSMYFQGHLPWDGNGRPVYFTQLMGYGYGSGFIPVSPLPPNVYHRSGTGTYLPNPKISNRDRPSSGTKRGSYSHNRSDNNTNREGHWRANSKSRAAGRYQIRSQSEKLSSRGDRHWNNNSYRNESSSTYQYQNGATSNGIQSKEQVDFSSGFNEQTQRTEENSRPDQPSSP